MHPERFGTIETIKVQMKVKIHLTKHATRFTKEEREYMHACMCERSSPKENALLF